jgi:hypothetical protein
MAFLRFVISQRHPDSGVEDGLFTLAYQLRDDPSIAEADRQLLKEHLSWFVKHLPTPERLNRTSSKGFYRRATKGIAWFRDSATECLARMHEMKRVIEAEGRVVTVITEDRIGYVVYEDDFQVIAEPFSDTQTR